MGNDWQWPPGQIGIQETIQRLDGSNPSCVERIYCQLPGRVSSTANRVAALSLDKEGCDGHKYYYGIEVIVLVATGTAESTVHCHGQETRRVW